MKMFSIISLIVICIVQRLKLNMCVSDYFQSQYFRIIDIIICFLGSEMSSRPLFYLCRPYTARCVTCDYDSNNGQFTLNFLQFLFVYLFAIFTVELLQLAFPGNMSTETYLRRLSYI